jgi:hypothetical protein
MHIWGQLALERDGPGRHVQVVAAARKFSYVTERCQAVAVRQVVCK